MPTARSADRGQQPQQPQQARRWSMTPGPQAKPSQAPATANVAPREGSDVGQAKPSFDSDYLNTTDMSTSQEFSMAGDSPDRSSDHSYVASPSRVTLTAGPGLLAPIRPTVRGAHRLLVANAEQF